MTPERAVAAIGDLVVEDEEIADLDHILHLLLVILGDVAFAHPSPRQHTDETQHRPLDQVDRGRFQRLHETRRQADGDAVAIPLVPPRARGEAQDIGLGQRLALDIAEHPVERRVLVQIAAAIDDAVRSEEHTSELQSLMRISYAVFCLKKKKYKKVINNNELNYTKKHLDISIQIVSYT